MEFQAEVGRQDEPPGHLLLLADGGQVLGQMEQEPFFEAALEEIPFVGLAEDFQGVELTLAKGVQDSLGMIFDESQVHQGDRALVLGLGQTTLRLWASWSAKARRAAVCLPNRARARW